MFGFTPNISTFCSSCSQHCNDCFYWHVMLVKFVIGKCICGMCYYSVSSLQQSHATLIPLTTTTLPMIINMHLFISLYIKLNNQNIYSINLITKTI